MRAGIAGIGLLGPGLDGWEQSAPVLRGDSPYSAGEVNPAPPTFLSSRERRRTSLTVRLALNVAAQAMACCGIPTSELAPVFGTGNGDGQVIHKLLDALAKPDKLVSPTQFHNSVHNAAVGYWSIGASSRKASTCIAAHDFTFAATVIKSMVHVHCEGEPVLTVVYDAPFPEPLNSARPMAPAPFGVAMVLTPVGSGSRIAEIGLVEIGHGGAEVSRPRVPDLTDLWSGNPAGRSIPMLEALAAKTAAHIVFQYPQDGYLKLALTPC